MDSFQWVKVSRTKDPDPSEGEKGAPFVVLWELTFELGHKSDLWHMINLSNMYDDGGSAWTWHSTALVSPLSEKVGTKRASWISPLSDEFTDQQLLRGVSPLSVEFTDQQSFPGVSPLSDEFTDQQLLPGVLPLSD